MSVSTEELNGKWTEIKGRLRERWGKLSGDELDTARGNVEQLIGTIQQKTGETREAVEGYLAEITSPNASAVAQASEAVREYAEVAKESMQDAMRYATETAKSGYAKAENTIKKRPMESLAVCFGAGLITGVVVGLALRSR